MRRFKFYINGHEWAVRLQPGPIKNDEGEDDDNIWGLTEYAQKRISVRTMDSHDVEVHPDHLRGVLMHEVMHAALHEVGYNPGHHYGPYNDEDVVGVTSPVVLAIFSEPRNLTLLSFLVPMHRLVIPMPDPDNMPSTTEWNRLSRIPDWAMDRAARLILSDEEVGDEPTAGEAEGDDTQRVDLCSVYGANTGLYCDRLRGHDELDQHPDGRAHNFTRPDAQSPVPARRRDIPGSEEVVQQQPFDPFEK